MRTIDPDRLISVLRRLAISQAAPDPEWVDMFFAATINDMGTFTLDQLLQMLQASQLNYAIELTPVPYHSQHTSTTAPNSQQCMRVLHVTCFDTTCLLIQSNMGWCVQEPS